MVASATISFQGNLSNDDVDHVVDSIKVFDALGGEHTLKVTATNQGTTTPGTWHLVVTDGATTVASGDINYINGTPDAAASTLSFTYSPNGVPAMALVFDFKANTTSFAAGTTSTLSLDKQDGFASGALTGAKFDE